jgi:DNA primase
MRISNSEIEKVKQANPLLGYLQTKGFKLKRKGKQYFIHCPLHPDTNESFAVDPYKQLWNCFGCGEGGDIYSLVMKLDNVDFRQVHLSLGGSFPDDPSNADKDNTIINIQEDEQTQSNEVGQLKALANYSNYYHQQLLPEKKENRGNKI